VRAALHLVNTQSIDPVVQLLVFSVFYRRLRVGLELSARNGTEQLLIPAKIALLNKWLAVQQRERRAQGCAPGRVGGVFLLCFLRFFADDVGIGRGAEVGDGGAALVPSKLVSSCVEAMGGGWLGHILASDGCRDDVHRNRHLDVLVAVKVAVVAHRHALVLLHVSFEHLHYPITRFSGLVDEVNPGTFADALKIVACRRVR
jgi:hypothetical protein